MKFSLTARIALWFARVCLRLVARGGTCVPALDHKYKLRERLDGPWCESPKNLASPTSGSQYERPKISKRLWLHGASLGECKMLLSVARALKADWPSCDGECPEILLTTQKAEALETLRNKAAGVCRVAMSPADLPDTLERFLKEVNPAALVLGENELWPGYVEAMDRHCKKPAVALVSGRVRKLAPGVSLDDLGFVTLQSDGGNWKLLDWTRDVTAPKSSAGEFAAPKDNPLIDVALVSFHKEELAAFGALVSAAASAGKSVVLAPRRLEEAGLFREFLLSQKKIALDWPAVQKGSVTIVNRFGLVPEILRSCGVAVVGGSFVANPGIHDFWEPLREGVKTFVGPFSKGAEEAVSDLVSRGVVARISCAGDVGSDWWNVALDPAVAQACLQEEREKILNSYERLLKFLLATV